MQIRKATPKDAEDIVKLISQLGSLRDAAEIAEMIERVSALDMHLIACAVPDGEQHARGWIHAEHRVSLEVGDYAEISGLIVDASLRRGGVGRHLIGHVSTWARARGLDRITVRSNAARVESHPFYAGLGFVRRRTQHGYELALGQEAPTTAAAPD